MSEQFVSEPIQPAPGTCDFAGMTRGEPGLPQQFTWRDHPYTVAQVLEVWKEDGPCRNGSPEMYLRKHWYRIRTAEGPEMTIYFERQPRSKRENKKRWWLYTVGSQEPVSWKDHERSILLATQWLNGTP